MTTPHPNNEQETLESSIEELLDEINLLEDIDEDVPTDVDFTVNHFLIGSVLRSMNYGRDLFVTLEFIPSGDTKKTKAVVGVAQHARWTNSDRNVLEFDVADVLMRTPRLPIKFLLQLIDRDYYGFNDLCGVAVLDLRAHEEEIGSGKAFEIEIDNEDPIKKGRLRLKVRYTKPQEMDDDDTISTQGKIEVEILTFSALEPDQLHLSAILSHVTHFVLFLILLILLALMIMGLEQWSFLDSWYFLIVLLTSVGYGEITPTTPVGKLFVVMLSMMAHMCMLAVISLSSQNMVHKIAVNKHREYLIKQQLDLNRESLQNEWTKASRESLKEGKEIPELKEEKDDLTEEANSLKASLITFGQIAVLWMVIWVLFFRFVAEEKMEWGDAIYFAVLSSTTVGFGDFSAQGYSDRKVFISFFLLFGVIAFANLAGVFSAKLSEWWFEDKKEKTQEEDKEEDEREDKERELSIEDRQSDKKKEKMKRVLDGQWKDEQWKEFVDSQWRFLGSYGINKYNFPKKN